MSDCYELHCTDCPFQATVAGSFDDAIEESENHRSDRSAGPKEHFVNVRRLE